METIVKMLQSPAAQALGWTLIHSLWQGLLCFLLGLVVLRFIPTKYSKLRYASSIGVLVLMITCSIVTLTIVYAPSNTGVVQPELYVAHIDRESAVETASPIGMALAGVSLWLKANVGVLSALWLIGAMSFAVRIAGGYWYVGYLRRSANAVEDTWQQRVDELAAKLNIHFAVEVAESGLINAPAVIGYLRPLILLPVGMFSGLTTQQLEAVFVHELMHIRRGDYLVNLVQTVLEAIYFFNPFVWMMSTAIRREREHCCDDGVVSNNGNTIAYVSALARLEEVKLSRTTMALSLAEDKNQLLKRIKRLMEKSVHRYSVRDRAVPAVLLVVGLVCASWLSIHSDRDDVEQTQLAEASSTQPALMTSDTVGKKKEGTYYHYSITTIDDNGKEDVRVVEGYSDEGDIHGAISGIEPPEPVEPMEPFVPSMGHFPMIAPVPPAHVIVTPGAHPAISPIAPHGIMVMPMMAPFDTLSMLHGWEEFGTLEETFWKNFEELDGMSEEDREAMTESIEPFIKGKEAMRAAAGEFAEAARLARVDGMRARDLEWVRQAQEAAMQYRNIAGTEEAKMAMEQARQHMLIDQDQRRHMHELNRELEALNGSLKVMEQRFQEAQESVRKEAVQDGYLKKDEKINSIRIDNDSVEINGKKIKPNDAKRYREMMSSDELHPEDQR